MPGSKEIRTKIKSVENTQKITKAMEMVAASKMRKAQERMRAARPYAEKLRLLEQLRERSLAIAARSSSDKDGVNLAPEEGRRAH